jgi:hypothetical protein
MPFAAKIFPKPIALPLEDHRIEPNLESAPWNEADKEILPEVQYLSGTQYDRASGRSIRRQGREA